MKQTIVMFAVSALALGSVAHAEVKLNSLFTDHAVLQREQSAAIWGSADAGEKVTVHFRDNQADTTAGADGKWKLTIPTGAAGGPFDLSVEGKNKVTLNDILVGEVWLCSGQSNMGFPVGHAKDAKTELASADHPKIRLFAVDRTPSDTPRERVVGSWELCNEKSAARFSAAAYFFARDLQPQIDMPIGLIESDWGGTPIESWISREALSSIQGWKEKVDAYFAKPLASAEEEADYKKASDDFQAARVAAALAKKAPPTTQPQPPKGKRLVGENKLTRLYTGMIAPLAPYQIRGALWYQGEANAGGYGAYQILLPTMITDWRKTFGQGDFPFIVVQLPNHGKRQTGDNLIWAYMREAQAKATASVPAAGFVCTIDTSSDGDLHPPEKQPVGHRLALLAEKMVYGKDVVAQGPSLDAVKIDGDHAVVTFKDANGGLVNKGDRVIGFEIAGDDHLYYPAEAKIDGQTAIVHSGKVATPLTVRYAWANNPEVTLYNKADLPAQPFRTDNFPPPAPKKGE